MKSERRKTKYFLIAIGAVLLALLAQPALAVTTNWVGNSGNWTVASNWDNGVPLANYDANLITTTANKTATYNQTVNPGSLNSVTVDGTGGFTFTINQSSSSTALSSLAETIGLNGKGAYNQSGGSNTVTNDLILGATVGSTGTYTKSGGSLSVGRNLFVGQRGTGSFTQSGNNVTVGGELDVSRFTTGGTPSVGTYKMSSGSLSVGTDENVGWNGTGTFTQSAGNQTITGKLLLGRGPNPSNGTFTMSSGTLKVGGDESIGLDFIGNFTQSSGTQTIGGKLEVGQNSGSTGTFTMSSGSLNVGGSEYIGDSGNGSFTQSSGSHTIGNTLVLSNSLGTTGTFKMSSGSLSVGSTEFIGAYGTGTFTQSSGSNTAGGDFYLAYGLGSAGAYSMTSSSLKVTGDEFIGNNGQATFTQTSGSNSAKSITLAANSPTTYADTYSITSGSVTAPGGFTINGPYTPIGTSPPPSNLISSTGGNFLVNGGVTVNAPVTNNGLIKTTNATVTWNGTVTNNSAYISDPATQTFVGNLNVTANGYLVGTSPLKPGPTALSPFSSQDVFVFKSDFLNTSIQNTAWNTNNAGMQFVAGASNTHELDITGGFVDPNSLYKTNNFGWFNMTIGASQIIDLKDTNGQNNPLAGSTDGALYVNQVVGATPTSFTTNALLTNIFNTSSDPITIVYAPHDPLNQYLITAGNPTGSYIIPGINGGVNGLLVADLITPSSVPLPPSVLLLGSGLLGLGAMGWRRKRLG